MQQAELEGFLRLADIRNNTRNHCYANSALRDILMHEGADSQAIGKDNLGKFFPGAYHRWLVV